VFDQRNSHTKSLTSTALSIARWNGYLLGSHKFFERMATGPPVSEYRLEGQAARLRSLNLPQELVCPLVVDNQNVIGAQKVSPPVSKLILTYGVKVHSRKLHVLQCGVGKRLLLT